MKKLAVMLALMTMATSAFALVNVAWGTGGFLSGNDDTVYLNSDTASKEFLWQLVYTTVDSVTTPDISVDGSGKMTVKYDTEGPAKVLSSRYWESGSSVLKVNDDVVSPYKSTDDLEFDSYASIALAEALYNNPDFVPTSTEGHNGYLYSVVFQNCAVGSEAVIYWAYTDPTDKDMNTGKALNWTDSMLTPNPIHFNLKDDTRLEELTRFAGVPEPATMSLLGLGALAMVIRRKLRK